ncbi:MAG: type VI secretion system tip protein VgrG, partial [Pseudomonadota bacterium]|nr:type VI secretion system tip protein VgrG [Pseudomonadota bacterium]
SRLIEREGIHYYFRHNEGDDAKHILVFTDNNASNPQLEPDELPYHHDGHAEDFDAIRTLTLEQQMKTRKVTFGDWDFEKKRLVREDTPTVLDLGQDHGLERYRYPGGFVEAAEGQHLSRMMMEAEEASHLRLRGESQIRTLAPGHTFTLYDHPFEAFNTKYMVLSVWHHGRNNLTGSGPSDYGNGFVVHPHDVTYRAPLTTPKGLVRGPQTALVTGPAGEEIYTDKHGRIKVQFHWDRQGNYDDTSSCWVRVAQVWAGNGYGTMFIPRIGMEVVVDFLNGDPDQPLVTGCVYNGVNKPPYDLPANATRSTLKTLSSKGGGGTNELRFEDKAGEEEVFLQAQKTLNVLVKADKTENVQGDANLLIGGKRTTKVTGDCHQRYGADHLNKVEGDYLLNPMGTMTLGSIGDAVFGSSENVAIAARSGSIEVKSGFNIVLDAESTISLKAGGSSVVVGPSGVSITGTMVLINSGGAPLSATLPSMSGDVSDASGVDATSDGQVTDAIQQLQAQALLNAARQGQPFCAECAAARAAYAALMA